MTATSYLEWLTRVWKRGHHGTCLDSTQLLAVDRAVASSQCGFWEISHLNFTTDLLKIRSDGDAFIHFIRLCCATQSAATHASTDAHTQYHRLRCGHSVVFQTVVS